MIETDDDLAVHQVNGGRRPSFMHVFVTPTREPPMPTAAQRGSSTRAVRSPVADDVIDDIVGAETAFGAYPPSPQNHRLSFGERDSPEQLAASQRGWPVAQGGCVAGPPPVGFHGGALPRRSSGPSFGQPMVPAVAAPSREELSWGMQSPPPPRQPGPGMGFLGPVHGGLTPPAPLMQPSLTQVRPPPPLLLPMGNGAPPGSCNGTSSFGGAEPAYWSRSGATLTSPSPFHVGRSAVASTHVPATSSTVWGLTDAYTSSAPASPCLNGQAVVHRRPSGSAVLTRCASGMATHVAPFFRGEARVIQEAPSRSVSPCGRHSVAAPPTRSISADARAASSAALRSPSLDSRPASVAQPSRMTPQSPDSRWSYGRGEARHLPQETPLRRVNRYHSDGSVRVALFGSPAASHNEVEDTFDIDSQASRRVRANHYAPVTPERQDSYPAVSLNGAEDVLAFAEGLSAAGSSGPRGRDKAAASPQRGGAEVSQLSLPSRGGDEVSKLSLPSRGRSSSHGEVALKQALAQLPPAGSARSTGRRRAGSGTSTLPTPVRSRLASAAKYDSASVIQLKLELKRRGLDSVFCFSKEDLIQRLLDDDQNG